MQTTNLCLRLLLNNSQTMGGSTAIEHYPRGGSAEDKLGLVAARMNCPVQILVLSATRSRVGLFLLTLLTTTKTSNQTVRALTHTNLIEKLEGKKEKKRRTKSDCLRLGLM